MMMTASDEKQTLRNDIKLCINQPILDMAQEPEMVLWLDGGLLQMVLCLKRKLILSHWVTSYWHPSKDVMLFTSSLKTLW